MNLTRNQLYELVWSKPIIVIAKEYGYSDVGFAKICKRHNIPLPPRGYWARINAGCKVTKSPLPNPHREDPIYIPPRNAISDDQLLQKKLQQANERLEIEKIGNIKIPNQTINPHKFTKNSQLYFEKLIKKIVLANNSKSLPNNYLSIISSIYRGRLVCQEKDCFNITVSENLVTRAISFLDVLAKELEIRGFKIKSVIDDKSRVFVVAIKSDEHISFEISEGYKYPPVEESSKATTKLDKVLYSDKKPTPTGKLTFSVYARETKIGRNWTDGKRLIETELPSIIHEFISIVPRQKKQRIDDAIEEERRKEQTRLFRENESRRYFEKSIYDEALKEAQAFREHKYLETYLSYLETQCLERNGNFTEQAISWFSTVRKVAQTKSPVHRRLQFLTPL